MTGYYVTVTVKYALVLNWSSRIVSCISKISPGAKLVRTDQFMSKETTACGQKYCHMYKKSLYNQPKPYFFKKLLWSHFWIDFNKFHTKTFRIVYILIVDLLVMFIWVVFICTKYKNLYRNEGEVDGSVGSTMSDCHWQVMESWVGKQHLVFCID